MAIFSVEGPYTVPYQDKPGGKVISEELSTFWDKNKKVRTQRGCYVFAIRGSRQERLLPTTVGGGATVELAY